MMIDSTTLHNLKVDYHKLENMGFQKIDGYYQYVIPIMQQQFELFVIIDKENIIQSKVIEIASNEEYILYNVKSSKGNYVGLMREEYQKNIDEIVQTCCTKNVFKSVYANYVIKYIKGKYGDEFEYLWTKFPENAVARNKKNNKWYVALLVVDKNKIGINDEGKVEIIDLMMKPDKIEKIVDHKKYFPGYHMNKKYWITIQLDGSVDIKDIYQLIDSSYALSLKKK
ncbi:MAG: MmcQ/YjbR family DNA-binding protein [Erysipelotrichaceae bacterium]|nr:MmcQ/YjbR family DNA-binding protein [Erysipelotrichaceae bacterium]